MECKDIKFGSYDCCYSIDLPYLVKNPCDPNEPPKKFSVCIDKCLLPEILKLWEAGIKTTGCCCGHGKKESAYIGVNSEHIEKMKQMGYTVAFNPNRPNDKDSFIPKTEFEYGSIDKGFHKWDQYNLSCGTCVSIYKCVELAYNNQKARCLKFGELINLIDKIVNVPEGYVVTAEEIKKNLFDKGDSI